MVPPDGYITSEQPPREVLDQVIKELNEMFPKRVSTSLAVREQFATDFSFHEVSPADAVITAHSSEEVSKLQKKLVRSSKYVQSIKCQLFLTELAHLWKDILRHFTVEFV